jgi:Flp pilus assembly protein TadG
MNHVGDSPMTTHPDGSRGQILALFALGLVAFLAAVGLVLDGGYTFTQQRANQNGTDAAANSGAIVLAQNTGVPTPTKTDADVLAAITATATGNGVTSFEAYYTDVTGQLVRSDGSKSGSITNAVAVGSGAIPPCTDINTCVDGRASGVLVVGHRTSPAFVSRVIGIESFPVTTQATAVAGYVTDLCPAAQGCGVIPVTVPVNQLTCDGTNRPMPISPPIEYEQGAHYTIPLCQNGPGNVGWLDWTPTAGGTSELAAAIRNPSNPELTVPGWYYVTSTGNVNAGDVEDALNEYAARGEVILIPQFDSTCNTQPLGNEMGDCPPANVGGTGSNQWYHLYGFTALKLDDPKGAYIAGSNKAACDTGNGATSCLKGEIVYFIPPFSTVRAGNALWAPNSIVGVQLVR